MPVDLDITIPSLIDYMNLHETHPVIAFYGGEPLLNHRKIVEIMKKINARAFMIQTNGTKLQRLTSDIVNKFHSILISIDGCKKTTDNYRGPGVYDKIINGIRHIRNNGFSGDLIARMTVSRDTDIFEEVIHLVILDDGIFNHVHWQLDVLWSMGFEEQKEEISNWLNKSYNHGIRRLVEWWVTRMENRGIIYGLAPFLGITYSLLTKIPNKLRCGAGIDFFSISTDGNITMCPILPSHDFIVGNIYNSNPKDIVEKIQLGEPCINCEIQYICGGRCLYTNKTKLWGPDGFELVCGTVKFLIEELITNLPRIEQAIVNHDLRIEDFKYPTIPNGVETIP